MQVWNLLHAARKCRTQKKSPKSSSGHHRTTLSGYIFATKARIDNRKKFVKQQYVPHMASQYGELLPTSSWDRFTSLGHPYKFQRLLRLGSVTARQSSSERQPNFAALNRGRHLCSAGRQSRWALAHILFLSTACGRLLWIHFDQHYCSTQYQHFTTIPLLPVFAPRWVWWFWRARRARRCRGSGSWRRPTRAPAAVPVWKWFGVGVAPVSDIQPTSDGVGRHRQPTALQVEYL